MAILAEKNEHTGIFTPMLPFAVTVPWPEGARFDEMIAWVLGVEQMGYYHIDFAERGAVRFSNAETAIRFKEKFG